jgi:hypothetical protein
MEQEYKYYKKQAYKIFQSFVVFNVVSPYWNLVYADVVFEEEIFILTKPVSLLVKTCGLVVKIGINEGFAEIRKNFYIREAAQRTICQVQLKSFV